MYTIQQALTTGPTAMNHIPTPHPREPVASPFYLHPYGGVGRDIYVSREGFARFFEMEPSEVDWIPHNIKAIDKSGTGYELLGYKIQDAGNRYWDQENLRWVWNHDAPIQYKIVFIDYTHGALMDHAVRNKVQNPQN